MLKKRSVALLALLTTAALVIMLAYSWVNTPRCRQLISAPRPQTDIQLISEELDPVRASVLKDAEAKAAWEQKVSFVAPESQWSAWVSMMRVEPNLNTNSYTENPVHIAQGMSAQASVLIRNGWRKPHA